MAGLGKCLAGVQKTVMRDKRHASELLRLLQPRSEFIAIAIIIAITINTVMPDHAYHTTDQLILIVQGQMVMHYY